MTAKQFTLRVSSRLAVIILMAALLNLHAQAKRRVFVPGRPAIIFDERFSALRAQPDVKAPLEQRLRRGRVVGILGAIKSASGARFLRVAVSRNTRGWILADAVVRPGRIADAARLMKLIEETSDDFTKARLARLCAREFRSTEFAPRALIILGETAERAAERLTRDAKRRMDEDEIGERSDRTLYFLNFTGLDRYNRIGVTFDYDQASDRIVYDGRAYRELLRRYPQSPEAKTLREKLGNY
jgi:hypothetical protein